MRYLGTTTNERVARLFWRNYNSMLLKESYLYI